MPYALTIGWKMIGDENCPKNRLEVSMPEALPLFFAETCDRNHAFVLTNNNPKAIPRNIVEKYSCATEVACETIKSPMANSINVAEYICIKENLSLILAYFIEVKALKTMAVAMTNPTLCGSPFSVFTMRYGS